MSKIIWGKNRSPVGNQKTITQIFALESTGGGITSSSADWNSTIENEMVLS